MQKLKWKPMAQKCYRKEGFMPPVDPKEPEFCFLPGFPEVKIFTLSLQAKESKLHKL